MQTVRSAAASGIVRLFSRIWPRLPAQRAGDSRKTVAVLNLLLGARRHREPRDELAAVPLQPDHAVVAFRRHGEREHLHRVGE